MSSLFATGPAAPGLTRRPIVLVEDHLYHIDRWLDVLSETAPHVLSLSTVVCLDRPGPDSRRAIARWLDRDPRLQVAAVDAPTRPRCASFGEDVFQAHDQCCRAIASLVRPGGLLLQDIQLETLTFIPRERWWASIFLASAVRGTFGAQPPACRFLSNKRGYTATFGCDLLDAGFDPRDVIDKDQLEALLVPVLHDFLDEALPFTLTAAGPGRGEAATTRVGPDDRGILEDAFDLLLWCISRDAAVLAGTAVETPPGRDRVAIKPGSAEATTWRQLVEDRLAGRPGLPVIDVGTRVAPDQAGRAEITNCAARHIHGLRARLGDGTAIRTVDHAYRLDDRLAVGLVRQPD